MKKTVILVIVSLLMSVVLFAEEPLAYKVTTTSNAYKQIKKRDGYDITVKPLQKDDIVYTNKKAKPDYIRSTGDFVFMMFLTEPNDEYEIHVKNLSPLNTENVFGDEIFIDYPPDRDSGIYSYQVPGDVKEMWVPSFF